MNRFALLLVALALPAACSKDDPAQETRTPAPEPPPAASAPAQAANPHAQPANPHAQLAPRQMQQQQPAVAANAEGRYPIGSLQVALPAEWQSQPITSSMRRAHFEIPAVEGDTAPAELIVYHFGQQGAGPVQENIDRWVGQFQQPDGKPSKELAKIEQVKAGDLKATTVDVSGRYVAAMMPGAADKHDSPGYRMLAAIVEAPDGAYYFKLVGPEKTVAAAADAFEQGIQTIQH